jgi:iron complex outermembrane receptor protein
MNMQRARRWSSVGQASVGQASRFAFTCLIFLTAIHARALSDTAEAPQNPVKALTLEQLGNVEVTSVSKEPERMRQTNAAIFVITNDDIRRSGVTSIPDALRLAPGVEVAQIDSNKWSIGIRGFGSRLSRDVLVLIDGRTVYSTLLAGTYWEAQNVLLEDIDRIEVIRGPGGTIWGPNAVNGIINIITKSTKETHGTYASAGGGDVDQGFLNARYGGGNGKTFDYRVYALGFERGPEFHTDGNHYDSWRNAQGGFRMDFANDNHDDFTAQGDIYDEGAGETVTSVTYAPPYQQVVTGTERLSGGNILGRWKRTLGYGEDFQLQVFYDRTNRHEPNFADIRNTFDIDFLDRFRLPWRQEVSWGGGARFSHGNNPTIVSGLYFIPSERTDQLITGFFQDEIGLIQNHLSLSVGTKLIHTNYTGLQLEPSGRLLWTPTDKQTIWAAFTHAVRTPSAAERAFYLSGFGGIDPTSGLPIFARFNANPDFKSEELNGYEFGVRELLGKRIYFDIAAFYNHYSDLFSEGITGSLYIETDPAPTHLLLPAAFGNGLLGTTRGFEFAPEWRPTNFWRLRASYSFLQMQLEKSTGSLDIGTGPITAGSSPRHQAVVQSGFDLRKRFNLDLTYRYVSALTKLSIASYSTADARFEWRATQHFAFSVVGQNIFQPRHYEYPSDPGPNVGIKRSVYGQIAWTR